jgi:hypothetical protein
MPGLLICNISGFEVTKREKIDICFAFMREKSRKFSRFQIKLVKLFEVSLELMD